MIIPEGQRPTVALAGHIVVPPLPVRGWLAGPSGPLRMQSHFIGRAARGSITPAVASVSTMRTLCALGVCERHRAQSHVNSG